MAEKGNVKISITNLSKNKLMAGKCLFKYAVANNFIDRWFWLLSSYYWKMKI